jgi:hypothetical protein
MDAHFPRLVRDPIPEPRMQSEQRRQRTPDVSRRPIEAHLARASGPRSQGARQVKRDQASAPVFTQVTAGNAKLVPSSCEANTFPERVPK